MSFLQTIPDYPHQFPLNMYIAHGTKIYLATPYSHHSEYIRDSRFHEVTRLAGLLLKEGFLVYSPITHSHPIAVKTKLPSSFDFWKALDMSMLNWADVFVLYKQEGWEKSAGVKEEFTYCINKGIPCYQILSWSQDISTTVGSKIIPLDWDTKMLPHPKLS